MAAATACPALSPMRAFRASQPRFWVPRTTTSTAPKPSGRFSAGFRDSLKRDEVGLNRSGSRLLHLSRLRVALAGGHASLRPMRCGWGLTPHDDSRRYPPPNPPPQARERGRSSFADAIQPTSSGVSRCGYARCKHCQESLADVFEQNLLAETLGRPDRHQVLVEGKLQGYAIDKGKHHRAGMNDVDRLEIPVAHPLIDNSADRVARPLIRGLVDRRQCRIVQGFTPQGHEHGPEFPIGGCDGQAGLDHGAKTACGIAPVGAFRFRPQIEVVHHVAGRGCKNRPLVPEIVVENALAHARLGREALHGQLGKPASRQTANGGAYDFVRTGVVWIWFARHRRQCRAISVPMESERGSRFSFDAFSSREPVSTSLENALPLTAAAMVGDSRPL